MDKDEYRWCIDAKLLQTMVSAKNMEKFISPTFTMCHLIWQIEAYPNGNTPSSVGSFNIYLRLISIPNAWKNITICRTFKCNETQSGYTAVSKYDKITSLGWPDFTLSLQDIKTRIHWLNPLQFIVQIKVLRIRLHKNEGQIFYENKLDPYKALKHQTISWKVRSDLLHEMKQSYFRKGFVSPIFNNMWCLRMYPAGKKVKGNFLIQLQLCSFPAQCDTVSAQWKIRCQSLSVSVEWKTDFNYTQSCWGWGNNHLSFKKFKNCTDFTVDLEVNMDTKDNIVAVSEWERFVNKRKKKEVERKEDDDVNTEREVEEKGDCTQNLPMPRAKTVPSDYHQKRANKQKTTMTQWIVNRLKIQDEILDALTTDVEQTKQDIDKLKDSECKHDTASMSVEVKNKLLRIQKQVDLLSTLSGNIDKMGDDVCSEKEKVKIWLRDKVKLPQYYDLFMDQGFDDMECITHITKEDLIAMNIEKIGHQRKILNCAQNIVL